MDLLVGFLIATSLGSPSAPAVASAASLAAEKAPAALTVEAASRPAPPQPVSVPGNGPKAAASTAAGEPGGQAGDPCGCTAPCATGLRCKLGTCTPAF